MRILLIDDDLVDRKGIRRNLMRSRTLVCEIEEAATLREARDALANQRFDCALLDLYLPDGTAGELLEELAAQGGAPLPIVILTGSEDDDKSLDLLASGAQDYLVKGQCSSEALVHAIRFAIARHGVREPREEDSTETAVVGPGPARVLVALPSSELGGYVRGWLEEEGFRVSGADSSESAVRAFEHPYALLILDLDQMLLPAAIAQCHPTLYLTSLDWNVARRKVEQVAECRVLVRPITRARLLHEVQALLQTRPQHGESLAGTVVHGYRFEEPIGRGAMGSVFRAVHVELDRQVAVKILPRDLSGDRESVVRFRREARLLARLDHPHIIPIHDLFEHNGRLHIVMGYAGGGSTRTWVEREGPLPEATAARLTREAALGLAAAAAEGVVHRDVKPDNLLLTAHRSLRIADFGLATMEDRGQVSVTRTGVVLGTPSFMAPEQWDEGQPTDARSDLYGLGCTLFYLLTGELPFKGGSVAAVMRQHLRCAAPLVRSLRSSVSVTMEAIVARLLAKRPEDRYPGGDALAQALQPLADGS